MSWHRVTINQDFRGRLFQNVIHLLNPDGLITDQQIANHIEADWIPIFRPVQWNSHRYTQIFVQQIQVAQIPASFLKTVSIVGTGSTTAAVGALSWKLQFSDGLAGRKHRGRYFIGGIANGFIDLSTEQAGAGTALNALLAVAANVQSKWCGGVGSLPLQLAIAHKDGDIPSLISAVMLDPKVTWLRSRKLGVGI